MTETHHEENGGDGNATVDALPIGNMKASPKPMASHGQPVPRHYPLDLPDAPFERYVHRLTARDIMIHRIMADFMSPSKVSPETYVEYVTPGSFDKLSTQNKQLSADLRCAQSMLFTSFADAPPSRSMPLRALPYDPCDYSPSSLPKMLIAEGPRNRPRLVGDQVLDLVRRHYFEADNAILRAWISHLGPVETMVLPKQKRPRGQQHQPRPQPSRSPGSWGFELGIPPNWGFPIMFLRTKTGKLLPRGSWAKKDTAHLQTVQSIVALQDRLSLYDGGIYLPHLRRSLDRRTFVGTKHRGSRDKKFTDSKDSPHLGFTTLFPEECGTMRFIMQPTWSDSRRRTLLISPFQKLDMDLNPSRARNRPSIWSTGQKRSWGDEKGSQGRYSRPRRRCTSLPPPGTFTTAFIGTPARREEPVHGVEVIFPHMTLSQLDRRSRRRSLSRTRIEELFDWDTDLTPLSPPSPPPPQCLNCSSPFHQIYACDAPCGHCGAPSATTVPSANSLLQQAHDYPYSQDYGSGIGMYKTCDLDPHFAPDCPVARHNRCKCVPFPTFHVAARCSVTCHRPCGNKASPGSFQHRNAMLCRERCCMCGLKGHNGKDCRMKKCRCGVAHLGQDCSWNPECRVKGCPRYWCGVHCRGCGSMERPFAEWMCTVCNPEGVAGLPEEQRGRRRRRKKVTGSGSGGGEASGKGGKSVEGEGEAVSEMTCERVPPTIFGGPRVGREGTVGGGEEVRTRRDDSKSLRARI